MYHIHIKHVLPEFSDSHDLSNYVLEIIHRKKQGFNFYPKKNTSYCVNHVLCFDFFSFGPNSSKNDQQHWQLNGHNFKFANFLSIFPTFLTEFVKMSKSKYLQKILRFVLNFWLLFFFFFAVFLIIFQYLVKLIKKVPVLSSIMLNIVPKMNIT